MRFWHLWLAIWKKIFWSHWTSPQSPDHNVKSPDHNVKNNIVDPSRAFSCSLLCWLSALLQALPFPCFPFLPGRAGRRERAGAQFLAPCAFDFSVIFHNFGFWNSLAVAEFYAATAKVGHFSMSALILVLFFLDFSIIGHVKFGHISFLCVISQNFMFNFFGGKLTLVFAIFSSLIFLKKYLKNNMFF